MYGKRLQNLGLTTLETRRLCGDLIELLKIFKGLDDVKPTDFFHYVINLSCISLRLILKSNSLNSQQINRINAFLRKARRLGLCSSTCLCDVSEYLRLGNCRLFNHIQCSSHCLSHLLPPEKHHLGLHPRGHHYSLPICPNKLCKSSFYTTKFIFFPLILFHLQCLLCFIILYNICVFVICLINIYQSENFFSVRVIDEWNHLPEAILHCSTLQTFIKHLDCQLKNRGYD